jgi:GTP-binding protein
MRFIDQTEIWVYSGDGGDGIVSFRRARNKPRLGPDGGSGGAGGSVIFSADRGMNTLATLRYRREYRAEDGGKGGTNERTGRRGDDIIVNVPLGTIIFDIKTNEKLGELTDTTLNLVIAKGGERGLGNSEFVTSIIRAPKKATLGENGLSLHLRLELKVLADIGLAGMPNAGKSTLLSRLSHAKPKIADYPFTTLHPMLGVVEDKLTGRSFVVADIPGLIEGASKGKGLGFEFLRHLERNKIIAYILDGSLGDGAIKNYHDLQHELFAYNDSFRKKQGIVVLNKIDLLDNDALAKLVGRFESLKVPVVPISAVTGDGLRSLIQTFGDALEKLKSANDDSLTDSGS